MTAHPAKQAQGFVASVLAGHSVVGLTFAALIYVLCLSGTVLVLANEIARWERPDGPLVASATPEILDRTLRAGLARGHELGSVGEVFLQAPAEDNPRILVQVSGRGFNEAWTADADGKLIARHDTPLEDFLVGLHFRLHVPDVWGLILVGIVGVFTAALIVSGVLAHPRILKDAFRLRWGGSKRLQDADLHNRLSVWGLPFHFMIALTGAWLGLMAVLVSFVVPATYGVRVNDGFMEVYGPGPGEDAAKAPSPDIQAGIADVLRRTPDASLATIIVQNAGTAGQLVHLTTTRPRQMAINERHFYDGAGKLLHTAGYDDGPAGIQLNAAMMALHYGWFGGWIVKAAYVLLGAALTVITATGVTIWLARWADKGRARTGWQRTWMGVVWGQPIALGLAAAAAVVASVTTVALAYVVGMAAAFAMAGVLKDSARLSRILRLAAAAALLSAAAVHCAVWFGRIADPMAWVINAIFAVLALMLFASIHRRRKAV
jgi:uncharacterized iron-regulated membrane protein